MQTNKPNIEIEKVDYFPHPRPKTKPDTSKIFIGVNRLPVGSITLGEYDLRMVSDLPENDIPEARKIYLKSKNDGWVDYIVLDPIGEPTSGILYIPLLGNSVLAKGFLNTNKISILSNILNITSKRGHTPLGISLGKGAFGEVYKGTWNDKPIAMKEIKIDLVQQKLNLSREEAQEALEWEISRLSTVSHPNIVQFYGIYEENDKIYLIMEFCENGDLQNNLKNKKDNIKWSQRWQWALEIATGLSYLHQEGVLHRDLKAENVLLDKYQRAIIADLGVAQVDFLLQPTEASVVAQERQDRCCMTPERIRAEAEGRTFKSTAESDIFTLGLVFFQLTTSERPYLTLDSKDYERKIPVECPESFKKLIVDCWKLDPKQRPKAEEVKKRLIYMAAEFYHIRSDLVITCERIEELIHHQRLEILKYKEPYLTKYELSESVDSFWANKENQPNDQLKLLNLKNEFEKFLKSPAPSTLLLLGEGGLGKTLSTYHLASQLMDEWWRYLAKPAGTDNLIPSYLPVPIRSTLTEWSCQKLSNALKEFSDCYPAIKEEDIPLLVIIDGYDECQTRENYKDLAEHLGITAFPNANKIKLLVTCRVNAVERAALQSSFNFKGNLEVYYFLPFKVDQLLEYLKDNLFWNEGDFQDFKQTLSSHTKLRTVLRNPFVLSLFAQSWTTISTKDFKHFNRFQIYEEFIEHWINTQQHLLSKSNKVLEDLVPNGSNLIESFKDFASNVAFTHFRREKVSKALSSWLNLEELIKKYAEEDFDYRAEKADETKKHRSLLTKENFTNTRLMDLQRFNLNSPLKNRAKQYEFSHRSFFEYFIAKRILQLSQLSLEEAVKTGLSLLDNRAIQEEPEALIFVIEGNPTQDLKNILFKIIEFSKQDNKDSTARAYANAITILNAANVSFSGMNLSGINIDGADLSLGILDSTNFANANLTGVSFKGSYLRNCNFNGAQMNNVEFGEQAYLDQPNQIKACVYTDKYLALAQGASAQLYDNTLDLLFKFDSSRWIYALAISPGQQLLAMGGEDKQLTLYDLAYKRLKVLTNNNNYAIYSIAFSADSKLLASGHFDGNISLWDMTNDEFKANLKHLFTVHSLTFLGYNVLISGSEDQTVRIWSTTKLKKTLKLTNSIKAVTVSSDSQTIAAGGLANTIYLWNTEDYELKNSIPHIAAISSLAFNPINPQELAVGSKDHTIHLYKTTTGELITTFEGHSAKINSICFKPDGKELISGSADKTLRIWNAQPSIKKSLYKHHKAIKKLTITLKPLKITAQSDSQESIWNINEFITITPCEPSITTTTNSNPEITATSQANLIYLNASNQPPQKLGGHNKDITALALSANNEFLASSGLDRSIKIWDIANFKTITTLKTSSIVTSIIWLTTKEQYLATGSNQGEISCFNFTNNDLQLLWTSSQTTLNAEQAIITKTLGLSSSNFKLLRQRKAIGSPIIQPEQELTMHFFSATGNLSKLKEILNDKNPNQLDSVKKTPLYWAAQNGHLELVEALIALIADINIPDENGVTPLCVAAHNGYLEVVNSLIAANADTNIPDKNGVSPLCVAAHNGYLEVVNSLIAANVDTNIPDKNGVSPLYMAALSCHLEVAKSLIAANAEVNARRNNDGETPLSVAAYNGYLEVVNLLIEAKAEVNTRNNNDETPISLAAQNGHLEVVKSLIDAKAATNIPDKNGVSPLYMAAQNCHLEVVKSLIDAKADTNIPDKNGVSPLSVAAQNGHLKVVKLLIEEKADLNTCNNKGSSPLYMAARTCHLEVVKSLIAANANVKTRNNKGVTPVCVAAQNGHIEVIISLIEAKADINIPDEDGVTPLCVAAYNGYLEVVKSLIETKAHTNISDNTGVTPLYISSQNGHLDVVLALLSANAAINQPNIHGFTPLYAAFKNQHNDIAKVLYLNTFPASFFNSYCFGALGCEPLPENFEWDTNSKKTIPKKYQNRR